MCLPVLLFGNWFVSAYGNPENIAANIAKMESGAGDASADSDSAGSGSDGEFRSQSDGDESERGESGAEESEGESEAGFGSGSRDAAFPENESTDELETPAVAEGIHSDTHDHDDLVTHEADEPDDLMTHEADGPDHGFTLGAAETDTQPLETEPADVAPLDTGDLVVETLPTTPTADPESPATDADPMADLLGGGADDITTPPVDLMPADLLPTDLADPLSTEPSTSPADSDLLTETPAEPTPDTNELDLSTLLANEPEAAKPVEPPKPEVRIWTRTDGRTARAVYVRVERVADDSVVVISPPDNEREFKLPLTALSAADVEYVRQLQRALQAN